MLNIAVSNGISKALKGMVKDGITVKWPNDLYHYDRKIGGVLIENSISGSVIKSSIVGIGLNVNQKGFDPFQVKTAVSLSEILQEDVNLQSLLSEICGHIEAQYLKLKSNNDVSLHEDYIASLYKFGQPSLYRQNGETFEGRIVDVTEQGLMVIHVNGVNKEYNFKEIAFLNDLHLGD